MWYMRHMIHTRETEQLVTFLGSVAILAQVSRSIFITCLANPQHMASRTLFLRPKHNGLLRDCVSTEQLKTYMDYFGKVEEAVSYTHLTLPTTPYV